MIRTIPLQPIAAQSVKTTIAGRDYTVTIIQKSTGLFFSVVIDEEPIVSYVICRDATMLITDYKNVAVNFMFVDTQGNSDPHYTGLGTRFVLLQGDVTPAPVNADAQVVVFNV